MKKKTKTRLLGVVFLGLSFVAVGVILGTFLSEQKRHQGFAKEDNPLINFDWRDE